MSHKKNNKKRSISTHYKIHRYLGLFVAISLVWLSFTGILLNHTGPFGLAKITLDNPLVLWLYGISSPPIGRVYRIGDNTGDNIGGNNNAKWIVQSGRRVYLDQHVIFEQDKSESRHDVAGNKNEFGSQHSVFATSNDAMILLGLEHQVRLYTLDGELIDALPVPGRLQGFGWLGKTLVIHADGDYFKANSDFTDWLKTTQNNAVVWVQEAKLTQDRQDKLQKLYRGKGPSLEQLLLDTHSGRLFGKVGVYFADMVAIFTILLTLIGVYLWAKRKQFKKRKNTQQSR